MPLVVNTNVFITDGSAEPQRSAGRFIDGVPAIVIRSAH
jgi:hypothetical protein